MDQVPSLKTSPNALKTQEAAEAQRSLTVGCQLTTTVSGAHQALLLCKHLSLLP
jgi:hypothetical protein